MKIRESVQAYEQCNYEAACVAVDPDGGSYGQSVKDVVEDLRSRKDGRDVAEVSASALADLIEALASYGILIDG